MKIYKQKASGYREEVEEGFNWWALLFGPFWFLFKGMVGKAILTFLGAMFTYLVFNSVGAIIFWIVMGVIANKQYEDYLIKKGYSVIKKEKLPKESEFKWQCDICGKKFKTKKEAEKHEKICKE